MEQPANNKGQELNTAQNMTAFDPSVFFGPKSHLAFIYKKTEKLAAAIYMITDFIKDSESIKGEIRDGALSLVSLVVSLSLAPLAERKNLIKEYQAVALEIVSFASIAQHSGFISLMNFQVLSREFNGLVSALEKDGASSYGGETVVLDPGFFDVANTPISHPATAASAAPVAASAPAQASIPDKGHSRTNIPVSRPTESKDGRQTMILKLLSKKSGLNIKDFATSITGCSEKTIQRELLAMVAAGTLKKEGERRWSTYSLA